MKKKALSTRKASEAAVVKKVTNEETRQHLRELATNIDPQNLLRRISKILEKGPLSPDKAEEALMSEAITMLGHERHYLVAESIVDERWRLMVMDLAQSLQKEYDCVTNSEIALAGLAAGSYYRSLRAARKMNALLERTEIGMVGVHLMAQVSKEIDRAERQYLSAIETLRHRRQPQMNLKIHTKAAFFGENQTFNTESQNPYETNDAQ